VDLKDYSEDLLNFSVNEFEKALGTVGGTLFGVIDKTNGE
jgi:hypothetical protein